MKTLVILAGGKSSRMGNDKTFLSIGEESFLVHLLKNASSRFDRLLVSAGSPSHAAQILEHLHTFQIPAVLYSSETASSDVAACMAAAQSRDTAADCMAAACMAAAQSRDTAVDCMAAVCMAAAQSHDTAADCMAAKQTRDTASAAADTSQTRSNAASFPAAVEILPDCYEGIGPMGGLLSIFEGTDIAQCAVLAVDLPLADMQIPAALLKTLEETADKTICAVMLTLDNGHIEACAAAYSRLAYAKLKAAFAKGRYSLFRALGQEHIRILSRAELLSAAPELKEADLDLSLQNINTADDYRTLPGCPSSGNQ